MAVQLSEAIRQKRTQIHAYFQSDHSERVSKGPHVDGDVPQVSHAEQVASDPRAILLPTCLRAK